MKIQLAATALVAFAATATTATTASAANRLVCAEEFTATWCGYCPSVAEALYTLMADRPNEIMGLMVHGGDSYTTTWGNSRLSFYNVAGYPTVWLDGWNLKYGSSGSVAANYNDLNNKLNQCLARSTDVNIAMSGSEVTGSQYKVSVELSVDNGGSGKNIRVHLIQAYNAVGWPESGEQQFNTVRQAAASFDVYVGAAQSHSFDHTFTLSGESLANAPEVTYLCIAQEANSSGPADIFNTAIHEHGEMPPADVTVGPSGDYTNIQDAIAAVGSGSTVTVMPGTYTGQINFNGHSINLVSTGGAEVTIIDAMQQGTAITMMGGEHGTMDGFTITGGYATIASAMKINGNPSILNCVLRDNVATSNYCVLSSGQPYFENNTFCSNAPNNIEITWIDGGGNSFEDTCPGSECPGDLNGDAVVNVDDILVAVAGFGSEYNVDTLLEVLEHFGDSC